MKIDEIDQPDFPRKLLDKKQFVRYDPETGTPQLIRMEPMVGEGGIPLLDTVIVFIDDKTEMVMERDAAIAYIESMNCVPLEINAQYKHRTEH
jgi:hypothetical protein